MGSTDGELVVVLNFEAKLSILLVEKNILIIMEYTRELQTIWKNIQLNRVRDWDIHKWWNLFTEDERSKCVNMKTKKKLNEYGYSGFDSSVLFDLRVLLFYRVSKHNKLYIQNTRHRDFQPVRQRENMMELFGVMITL